VPYAVLAYLDFLIIVVASRLMFGLHIKGSIALLLLTAFFYLIGVLGIGFSFPRLPKLRSRPCCRYHGIDAAVDSVVGIYFPIRQMPRRCRC